MIELNGLTKTFRVARRGHGVRETVRSFFNPRFETVTALDSISFTVGEGEIVGYIGPNGAGKSTSIKVMCGILIPDSGECIVDGLVPWKKRREHVKKIGAVFGQRSQLWWDIPVIDSLMLLKDIYRIPDSQFNSTRDLLCDILDIGGLLKTPVRQLSLGQRMRCEFAASLIHSPKILFLDEPTIGLDAVAKLAVRDFISKINREQKVTIILTTHDTHDIEAICERVMLIGRGKILYDGSFSSLKEHFTCQNITEADKIIAGLYKEYEI